MAETTIDKPDIVHEFRKSATERVLAYLSEYHGRPLANIRVWFEDADGNLRPTKKGLSISVDRIPDLEEAVRKLGEAVGEKTR